MRQAVEEIHALFEEVRSTLQEFSDQKNEPAVRPPLPTSNRDEFSTRRALRQGADAAPHRSPGRW